ncbi:MAG: ABC transporter ATP-binding protein [Alphaproteobacteria bacterium]
MSTARKKKRLAIDRQTWPIVKRIVREYMRRHWPRLLLALACMVVAAAATAAMAKYIEPILDGAMKGGTMAELYVICGIILGIFLAKGFATYGEAVLMAHVGQRIIADIQIKMYDHVIRSDLAYLHNTSTGKLISNFTNDVTQMRAVTTDAVIGIGKDTLTLIFLVGLMFYQDWILACVAFFVFPVAFYPIIRIGRRMRKVSANTQNEMAQFTTLLDESFQGARHVKAYGMENYETGRATGVIDKIFKLNVKANRVKNASHPIMETLGGFAIVAVTIYGGWQVLHGGKTPGAFFSFVTALLLAYEPMKKLARLNANLQQGLAAAQRVFKLLDDKPVIVDKPDAKVLREVKGEVRFNDVTFAYRPDLETLHNLTLDIPAGRTVALVGPSGGGKSTILNLIPRFYDVQSGSVTVDGNDVRDVTLASLRAHIGLVSQEISLFDDSVRANIAYGKQTATEAEIVAAAKAAAAHEFILQLPNGYDTPVGAHGVKLSGGQRQRLAIARAML